VTEKKTPRRVVGKRIATATKMNGVHTDIAERLGRNVAGGMHSAWWAEGAFVRHIALGLFEPVSLCGRWVGSINSSPMPTPIGMTCRRCVRVWNEATALNNIAIEAANERAIQPLVDQFDALVGDGDEEAAKQLWRDNERQGALRRKVVERLDERGVDLLEFIQQGPAHSYLGRYEAKQASA
jgi:hypothetical protein